MEAKPQSRKNSIQALEKALHNQGKFSVLVLGDRGTGKSYWINQLLPNAQKVTIPASISESNRGYWEERLVEAHDGYLIIDEVEKLSHYSQEFLFEAFSTNDGYYRVRDTPLDIRIVFLSSVPVQLLKRSNSQLVDKFFDRISQLVIHFPSFKEYNRELDKDFESVWEGMAFDRGLPEQPKYIEQWMHKETSLNGNFRDLQKICIMLHHYRYECELSAEEAWERTKTNFDQYNYYPLAVSEQGEFKFSTEESWVEIHSRFKKTFKKWARSVFPNKSLRAIEDEFGIGRKTMDNW